jgi:malonyl CoA-acyl carrier protein transacylase
MRALAERHAPHLAELVVAEVGEDPFERADDGTAFAQPAIVCASLAAWKGAGEPGAALLAGHSLGEISALAAGGALEPEAAVRLAVIRGRLMQEAAEEHPGGMIALLGDSADARDAADAAGVSIANDNGPTQLVAAGPAEGIDAAGVEAKARGVRAIRLGVAGAFHTEAMAPAAERLREALDEIEITPPTTIVFSSTTARPFAPDADPIRNQLAAALTQPVRWRETLLELHRLGARRFLEVGPGKALTGLARRAFDDAEASVLVPREASRV